MTNGSWFASQFRVQWAIFRKGNAAAHNEQPEQFPRPPCFAWSLPASHRFAGEDFGGDAAFLPREAKRNGGGGPPEGWWRGPPGGGLGVANARKTSRKALKKLKTGSGVTGAPSPATEPGLECAR